MNFGTELDLLCIIEEAKALSINYRHGLINLDHYFVAILTSPCYAQEYLAELDPAELLSWLENLYPNTAEHTDGDTLPETLVADRAQWHATYLSTLESAPNPTSIHLLLAILSFDNHVAEKAKMAGVIFEDIALAYYKKPFPRKGPQVPVKNIQPPKASWWTKLRGKKVSIDDDWGEELYQHAHELSLFQQHDDCIAICRKGLEHLPSFDRLKELLAQSLSAKKDYMTALPHFIELDQLYPDVYGYKYSIAYIYSETAQYAKAKAVYDQLLVQYPDDSYALNNIAFDLYKQGQYAEAVPFYERAIEVDPTFAYPWNNLGFAKYKLGNTEEGLILIDKALQLDKGDSYAYMFKGKIYMEQGNKELAMENFQLALKYRFTETYGEEVLQLIKQYQ